MRHPRRARRSGPPPSGRRELLRRARRRGGGRAARRAAGDLLFDRLPGPDLRAHRRPRARTRPPPLAARRRISPTTPAWCGWPSARRPQRERAPSGRRRGSGCRSRSCRWGPKVSSASSNACSRGSDRYLGRIRSTMSIASAPRTASRASRSPSSMRLEAPASSRRPARTARSASSSRPPVRRTPPSPRRRRTSRPFRRTARSRASPARSGRREPPARIPGRPAPSAP